MKNTIKHVDILSQSYINRHFPNIILKHYSVIVGLSLCLLLILTQTVAAQVTQQQDTQQRSQVGSLALHTVSTDETLFAIAKRYDTSVEEIVSTNQLTGQTIYVGQRLYIPANDTISAQAPSASQATPVTVESQGFYITVAPGESLLGIALRYGVAIGELATINHITDVTNIPAGSSLYIPQQPTTVNAAPAQPAQALQTVAQGSGVKNIQIVASRHRIGAASSGDITVYPNGPSVQIGVATTSSNAVRPLPVSTTQPVPVNVTQPQSIGQVTETVIQPVGGFVPEDQSPKQQLLQQQMVLLRKSGPQLSIFQPPLQEFSWPLEVKGRISSNYGSRKLAITSNRFHYGLDLAAVTGTSVKASKAGTVKEASWIGGYGNAVYIDHPDGTQTRYAHMSELNVKAGDSVAQGDIIGEVGSTGVSTGPHLHFEIRVKGYAVDPMDYLIQP